LIEVSLEIKQTKNKRMSDDLAFQLKESLEKAHDWFHE
jgi:hypothetical protein